MNRRIKNNISGLETKIVWLFVWLFVYEVWWKVVDLCILVLMAAWYHIDVGSSQTKIHNQQFIRLDEKVREDKRKGRK